MVVLKHLHRLKNGPDVNNLGRRGVKGEEEEENI